jgi:hypothetical protein
MRYGKIAAWLVNFRDISDGVVTSQEAACNGGNSLSKRRGSLP